MRRWKLATLLLVIAIVAAGSASAVAFTGADPADDGGNTIAASKGETFEITLDSNPTTGYSWQAEFDESYLELVDTTFAADSDLIGAGGQETLVFKAIAKGQTTVQLLYQRPWEGEPIDTRSFDVEID